MRKYNIDIIVSMWKKLQIHIVCSIFDFTLSLWFLNQKIFVIQMPSKVRHTLLRGLHKKIFHFFYYFSIYFLNLSITMYLGKLLTSRQQICIPKLVIKPIKVVSH